MLLYIYIHIYPCIPILCIPIWLSHFPSALHLTKQLSMYNPWIYLAKYSATLRLQLFMPSQISNNDYEWNSWKKYLTCEFKIADHQQFIFLTLKRISSMQDLGVECVLVMSKHFYYADWVQFRVIIYPIIHLVILFRRSKNISLSAPVNHASVKSVTRGPFY